MASRPGFQTMADKHSSSEFNAGKSYGSILHIIQILVKMSNLVENASLRILVAAESASAETNTANCVERATS